MGANQRMRWPPRGAQLGPRVRTAVMSHTVAKDHAAAETPARRRCRRAA
jgi:hypothetical protein